MTAGHPMPSSPGPSSLGADVATDRSREIVIPTVASQSRREWEAEWRDLLFSGKPDGPHFLSASSRGQPLFRRSEEPALSAVEGISRREPANPFFTPPSGVWLLRLHHPRVPLASRHSEEPPIRLRED